jgi:hypothetical protein
MLAVLDVNLATWQRICVRRLHSDTLLANQAILLMML